MTTTARQPRLQDARRIVVKIGSALLVDDRSGRLRTEWLAALAEDLSDFRKAGKEVVVVSSGAIAAGRRHLGLTGRDLKLEEKQAAAAAGQIRLAHAYQEALAAHSIPIAQILLTPTDTEERRRHLNARATLLQLLKLGAIPVVNENDTVATQEIRYGDNDRLAARVATMISADTLVLLTDIDGMYTADPGLVSDAEHVPVIDSITDEIEAMAGESRSARDPSGLGTGGMTTKIQAAKLAYQGGCATVIGLGSVLHPLRNLQEGARSTWVVPSVKPLAARKKWIAGSLNASGAIVIDAGAVKALSSGRSLLPAGVTSVSGSFDRGDAIRILDPERRTIGTGLCAYSSEEATLIAGHQSSEIPGLLGYEGRTAMIHRDDLVLSIALSMSDTE
ncbi:MAG: glutamate 5-kinase [Alphaproteobacteria bacterium]